MEKLIEMLKEADKTGSIVEYQALSVELNLGLQFFVLNDESVSTLLAIEYLEGLGF